MPLLAPPRGRTPAVMKGIEDKTDAWPKRLHKKTPLFGNDIIAWQFAKDQAFTAGIGVHSRAESPAVYQAQIKSEDGDIIFPNERLGLTRASHFVLGYKNRLTRSLAFKTEIYYQDLFNVPIRPESATAPFDQTFSSINAYGGFTTDTLVNKGTGTNYGVEMTLEKYFSGSYYFLTTASLFESRYTPADRNSYNSRFNGNFIYNFTGGKEFKVGRGMNNVFALNTRLIWAGGNRVTPIDVDQSNVEGKAVYLWNRRFEKRLGDYFRIDIGLSYRKNKENYSSIVALNIQNILGRENDYGIYYNRETGTVKTSTQMGMFPNLSYRIEF